MYKLYLANQLFISKSSAGSLLIPNRDLAEFIHMETLSIKSKKMVDFLTLSTQCFSQT